METDPYQEAECCALPELNAGEILCNDAVEQGENNRKREVDDEGVDRQVIVAVEADGGVHLIRGHSKLLQKHLRRICGIALRSARRERNFPAELDDCREDTA